MQIQTLNIPDIKIITPQKFGDDRGFFSETYNKKHLAEQGIDIEFVQDNHAYSAHAHTMRGCIFKSRPLPRTN